MVAKTKAQLFGALVVLVLIIVLINKCNKPVNQPILDTNALIFSRDSAISSNNAISMDYAAFKATHLAAEDSLTKIIQKQASHNTISIAAISTKISVSDSGKTVVTTNSVVISKDSLPCNPTFSYDKTDSAQIVHASMNKDSTRINFTLFNRQTIESKFVSSGILGLGKKSIVLQVENSNPHIRTTNQVSFVKPLPKPNRLLWLACGIAAGSLTVLYLTK